MITCCESGVIALAITPPGVFGALPHLQGFKPRSETLAQAGPSKQSFLSSGDGKNTYLDILSGGKITWYLLTLN